MSDTSQTVFTARQILLPIDFSPASNSAFAAATGLAQQFHAGIHLLHIIPEIPDFNGADFFPETAVLEERRSVVVGQLQARQEQLTLLGITSSFSIDEGNDIVGGLMRAIKREQIDLVVISTHGMSGWHPLLYGSIAEQVIKQVNCTLLLLQSNPGRALPAEPALAVWDDSFVPHGTVTSQLGPPETFVDKQLDRIADALAGRGGRTEQAYDQAHPLFTK